MIMAVARGFGFSLTLLASTMLGGLSALAAPADLAPKDPQILSALKTVSVDKIRADDLALVSFGTRNSFSEDLGPKRGITAARDWIADQFRAIAEKSDGRMTVSIDTFLQKPDGKRVPRDVNLSNVMAVLKGSEPGSRTYVLSSHYDSRNSDNADATKDAPGADDNASGVVAVLAAARALAAMPVRATIIFIAYSAEEQGLLGSNHHAQALKEAGIDVHGDVNNDIVGSSTGPKGESNPHVLRIFSEALPVSADIAAINSAGGENDSASRELARLAKEMGDTYTPPMAGELIYRTDRYLRGGDHMSFYKAGFPAIRFVEPVESFDHQHQDVRMEGNRQYGDLPAFMDFDYLARVAKYNIAVIGSLALAPAPPKDAVILTKELTNETDLSWSAVPGAVRYEVVTRKTYEPFWTASQDTGSETHAHLNLSKDNYLFAVRSVDAQGHKSVAAFPKPQR
jgi:hypothetical protein